MSSQPLVLNVILDWDDFHVHRLRRNKDNSKPDHGFICSRLKYIVKNVDERMVDTVDVLIQERNTSNLYYETDSIIRFQIKITLNSFTPPKKGFKGDYNAMRLQMFLKTLASRNDLRRVYFSLDSSCEKVMFPKMPLEGNLFHFKDLQSFKLGTIVGVGNFVSHFDSVRIHPNQLEFRDLRSEFRHDLGSLSVYFWDPLLQEEEWDGGVGSFVGRQIGNQYELRISYDSIHSHVLFPSVDSLEVFLILKSTPLLYKKPHFKDEKLNKINVSCREKTFDMRGRKFYANHFGKCNVISLKMPLTGFDPWKIISTMKLFMDFSTSIPFYLANISCTKRVKSLRNYYWSPFVGNQVFLPDFMMTNDDLLRAFDSPMSLNHYVFSDLTLFRRTLDGHEAIDWSAFWVIVKDKFDEDPESVKQTFYDIFRSLERNSFIRVLKDFPVIYESRRQEFLKFGEKITTPGMCSLKRVVMTPTRKILIPPHPVFESRLLAECEPGSTLRTRVCEENGQKLTFTLGAGFSENLEDKQLSFLRSCIKKPILKGLQVASRRYEFMATTSSQIREHGLLLYAEDTQNRRAKDLKQKMGDFFEIRCVGKHIARVGQTLSQRLSSITIDPGIVYQVCDIMRGKHPNSGKPYVFTDGIGMASLSLARKMAESLPTFYWKTDEDVPSAFQIRYQGYKGMLVVEPTLTSQDFLILRESMNKFASETNSLEILKISKPRAVYLNRPLINLLDQLGTDINVIGSLLNETLKSLAKSLIDDDAAAEKLSRCRPLFCFLDPKDIKEDILRDPFLTEILKSYLRTEVLDLKKRARIPIPFDSGRMMFGVVDERRVLKYGQVFVQFSTNFSGTKTAVLEGDVMVSRNPCVHPGDIRMLKAVDNPLVRACFGHIKDCIVFPQKGRRPHPNEMGGGDLDGDEYAVIWMKGLFIKKIVQPMNFSDEPALELNEDVKDHHQLEFICNFIQSDSIGSIANACLAVSDFSRQGVFDSRYLKLCEKHSMAIDYSKTGRNCRLSPDEKPKFIPHYFEKGAEKYTYKSDRALGLIYDRVSLFEMALNEFLHEDASQDWKLNPNFIHAGWEKYEKDARTDYHYYESRMTSLMKELGVESEVALVSTIIGKHSRFFSGKKDMTDLQEVLERMVQDEFDEFRRRFITFDDIEWKYVTIYDIVKKASAYYHISHQMNQQTVGIDTKRRFFGFHWIAAAELAIIKLPNEKEQNFDAFAKIASLIDEFVGKQTQDLSEVAIQNILLPWIKKHPIHGLRWKFNNKALIRLMKEYVEKAYTFLLSNGLEATVGSVTMKTLEQLSYSWIEIPITKVATQTSKTLLQLGLAAITTYFQAIQTTSINSVVDVAEQPSRRIPGDKYVMKQYHINLVLQPEFADIVKTFRDYVLRYLQRKSGVKEIAGRVHFQGSYQYWLVTAIGNKWQLDTLNERVIAKNFCKTVIKTVKKQLRAEGITTDFQ